MKRILTLTLIASFASMAIAPTAQSAVNVNRSSSENPVIEVSRSIIYGGLAGLMLGSAFALTSDGDNDGDIVRWCFVGGTMVGFATGVYFVSNRPQPDAMIELGEGALQIHTPTITPSPSGSAQVALVGVRF